MMSYTTKLKIGAFSQMMQVTVKTLRHYEQKGILLPHEVDEFTGYRYYTLEQMQRLNNIRFLQRLGFSLDEIKELLDDDSHDPDVDRLNRKIEETDKLLRQLIDRRAHLLNWRNAIKEINTMEKFSIQSLPEIIVASHREVIPSYEAIGKMCCEVIGPEMHRWDASVRHRATVSLWSITMNTRPLTSTWNIANRWKRLLKAQAWCNAKFFRLCPQPSA